MRQRASIHKAALSVGAERNPYRGTRFDQIHATVQNGIIDMMGTWRTSLSADGVALSVYNPRSLLSRVLPVYERPVPSLPRGMTGSRA